MDLLKKDYWWVWLLLTLCSSGCSVIALAALLGVLDKKAWYANWRYWVLGLICFIFPASIMLSIFIIQILCQVSAKLNVPGKEIYLSPYIWVIAIIVPFLGWLAIGFATIYLEIAILISLYQGNGEQYIK